MIFVIDRHLRVFSRRLHQHRIPICINLDCGRGIPAHNHLRYRVLDLLADYTAQIPCAELAAARLFTEQPQRRRGIAQLDPLVLQRLAVLLQRQRGDLLQIFIGERVNAITSSTRARNSGRRKSLNAFSALSLLIWKPIC